jgi:muramoyltetrapeptide carboxypeptidase
MVAMDFARGVNIAAQAHLRRLLAGESAGFELTAEAVLKPGTARGQLIGGCLSVIVAMLGTPWEPRFDGRVLFLEDTGEKAYRVDRMLTQLRQAGILRRVAGIVFGAIHPVNGNAAEGALTAEFMAEQTADLDCPVLSGIEAGHGTQNFVLPLGLEAQIDSAARHLIFTESAVLT